jgi:hypothetical protein
MSAIAAVFILLLLYQLKHFLADYPLQRPWMLGKFLPGWNFVPPLAAHCAVHALMTFAIAVVYSGSPWLALGLAGFDFGVHFLMDRIKASPKWMGRWKPVNAKEYMECQQIIKFGDENNAWLTDRPSTARARLRSNRLFWDALGFDQMVHHLTHYTIIFLLIRYS